MLVGVERLLRKLGQPGSRAAELDELSARLRAERAAAISDEEHSLALAAHHRKLAISSALRGVSSCSSCATGAASPVGDYAGGACCAGVTAHIFDDAELAALAHAGTRPSDLRPPPRGDIHAGCAFRGELGCALATEHRPSRCVHYVCDSLQRELYDRGQLDAIEADLADLRQTMERLAIVRSQRADAEVLAPLLAALAAAKTRG